MTKRSFNLLVGSLAIVAVVAIFGAAIWTGTSLGAAFFFAWLIVLIAGSVAERWPL